MVSAQATTEPAPEPRPGPTGMSLRLGPFDEVGDDQEVAGEAHAGDDVELEVEPLAIGCLLLVGAARRAALRARHARRGAAARPRRRRGAAGSACACGAATAQRWAITAVLAIASGRSANSSAIAAPSLSQASGDERDAVGALDIGRIGDAQHRVVRGVEAAGRRKRRGWSRPAAGRARRRARSAPSSAASSTAIAAARQLDIEPVGEQRLQAGRDRLRPCRCWPSASSRASAPSPPAVSAIRPSLQALERRRTRHAAPARAAGRDAPPRPACTDWHSPLVLGEQRPASRSPASPPMLGRPRDAEHRADDRLHALGDAGVAERHRAVEPVAVGERDRRESRASPRARRSSSAPSPLRAW